VAGDRRRPALASFVLAAAFAVVDDVVELPWSAYAGWWREKGYGLTSQAFVGWLGEHGIGLLIAAFANGLFFMALYALIRRSPRRWWLWAGGLTAGFFAVGMLIAPVLIEPIFNRFTPAPAGPTRAAVVALGHAAGVPTDKIFVYDGSKQSNRYTANMAGIFGTARVALSDVMFKKNADMAEIRGVVGHEMGHYKRGHAYFDILAYGLLALAAFGLVAGAFPTVERWVDTGARGVDDPVGLPVLSILIATFFLIVTPLTSSLTRLQEADADAFSLRVAHEPTGLAKALVKSIEYRADSPSDLEEFLFYDHPSVRHRVQSAMDWKAAQFDEAASQEAADAAAPR
jgi:STE24 endopeptidase